MQSFFHPFSFDQSLLSIGDRRWRVVEKYNFLVVTRLHPHYPSNIPPHHPSSPPILSKTNWKRRDTRRLESTRARNHGSDKSRVAPINVVIRKWRVWNARNNKSGPLSGGARAGSTLLINIRQSNIHNVMEAA